MKRMELCAELYPADVARAFTMERMEPMKILPREILHGLHELHVFSSVSKSYPADVATAVTMKRMELMKIFLLGILHGLHELHVSGSANARSLPVPQASGQDDGRGPNQTATQTSVTTTAVS